MIERARESLGDEVELIVCDLLELELAEPVDAVFSNATFHWILDHRRLFERLHAVLRPGGRLEAQCGGIGNLEDFLNSVESVNGDERFAPYLRGIASTWNFASPGDTEIRLQGRGLRGARAAGSRTGRRSRATRARTSRPCASAAHLEQLPKELRAPYMDAVLEVIPRPLTLDYVRLNISARRP